MVEGGKGNQLERWKIVERGDLGVTKFAGRVIF
jgi:hypothetical protein